MPKKGRFGVNKPAMNLCSTSGRNRNRQEKSNMKSTIEIYRSTHATAWLSTEHPSSSYGQPALLVQVGESDPEVVGWSDMLPSGLTGADFLELVSQRNLEPEARAMLDSLLRDVRAWRGGEGADA